MPGSEDPVARCGQGGRTRPLGRGDGPQRVHRPDLQGQPDSRGQPDRPGEPTRPVWGQRDGFSLAEVLLAVALLGTLAIAVMGLMTTLGSSAARAREGVRAHMAATGLLENELQGGYDALVLGTVSGSTAEGIDYSVVVSQEAPDLRRIVVRADDGLSEASVQTLLSHRW